MSNIIFDYIDSNKDQIEEHISNIPKVLDIDEDLLFEGLKEKENNTLYEKTKYVVFENHPKRINKTYKEHMKGSIKLAVNSLFASLIYLVHAFVPILFTDSGTKILRQNIELAEKLKND